MGNPLQGVVTPSQFNTQLAETANQLDTKIDQSSLEITNSIVTLKADKTYVDVLTQSLASGSPKTDYATLVLLQAGIPLGNTNTYLTTDGKWNYWNGSAWVIGGTYQATSIASKSVDETKLTDALQAVVINPKDELLFLTSPLGTDITVVDTANGYTQGVEIYGNTVITGSSPSFETPSTVVSVGETDNTISLYSTGNGLIYSNPIAISKPLRGMFAGYVDTITKVGGQYVLLRKSQKIVLDNLVVTNQVTVNTDTVTFRILNTAINVTHGEVGYCDKMPYSDPSLDRTKESVLVNANTQIYLQILKSRLSTYDQAGLRTLLTGNPIAIYHQIATQTEAITQLVEMRTYQGSTRFYSSNVTKPTFKFNAPLINQPQQFAFTGGSSKLSIEKHLNIFGGGLSDIYWCWLVKVDDKLVSPLGKYYLFYSTDHAGVDGFISMAHSNSPFGPFTNYGQVYKNYDAELVGLETETPSVMWDEANGKLIMYFHSRSSFVSEEQTTWTVTSVDGINWANKTKTLTLDVTKIVGKGHNGYFHPFRVGNKWFAYHLIDSTYKYGISYSKDGYKWYTDLNELGCGALENEDNFIGLTNNRFMSWNFCTPIYREGKWWLLGTYVQFVAGETPQEAYIAMVEIKDDFKHILGKPKKMFNLDGVGESGNIRGCHVYSEYNLIYIYYQCDNILHCAILR